MRFLGTLAAAILFASTLLAQNGTESMQLAFASGEWLPGYIVKADGKKEMGEVKAFKMQGQSILTMRFRKGKGADAATFSPKELKEWGQKVKLDQMGLKEDPGKDMVVYESCAITKKEKKKNKPKFVMRLVSGKNSSVYLHPEYQRMTTNKIEMPNTVYLKSSAGEYVVVKQSLTGQYKKKMDKVFSDCPAVMDAKKDKKFYKYGNLPAILQMYNNECK